MEATMPLPDAADVAWESNLDTENIRSFTHSLRLATKDLRRGEMSASVARWLVATYYSWQEQRINAYGRLRAQKKAAVTNETLTLYASIFEGLEDYVRLHLRDWVLSQPAGPWALSIAGVGPVLAAGVLTHIDLDRAPTASAVWRYFGLDPTIRWVGREEAARLVRELPELTVDAIADLATRLGRNAQRLLIRASTDRDGAPAPITRERLEAVLSRRPWNAQAKVLAWKLGDSFVKLSGRADRVMTDERWLYVATYATRKAELRLRNERGEFRELAERTLAERNIRDKETRAIYESGRLPAGRLELMARRVAVKLFLSHAWEVIWKVTRGEPPRGPYAEQLGHQRILVPGFDAAQ